jgi:hypothetical protein
VSFTVEDSFLYAAYCHCSRCRHRSGAAFKAFGGLEIGKLRVTAGEAELVFTEQSAEGYNAFCGRCFAPLFSAVGACQRMHVNLGALLDAPSKKPDHHLFVGSKAPWHEITDDLPRFDGLPGVG